MQTRGEQQQAVPARKIGGQRNRCEQERSREYVCQCALVAAGAPAAAGWGPLFESPEQHPKTRDAEQRVFTTVRNRPHARRRFACNKHAIMRVNPPRPGMWTPGYTALLEMCVFIVAIVATFWRSSPRLTTLVAKLEKLTTFVARLTTGGSSDDFPKIQVATC